MAELQDGSPSNKGDADGGESESGASFLTYLLWQTQVPAEEANSHAVDLMIGGVETVISSLIHVLVHCSW